MYARGLGVTQDWVTAYMWFALVAARAESNVDRDNAMSNQTIAARRMRAIDSGCVWGRQLTAIRLEDRAAFQVEGLSHP